MLLKPAARILPCFALLLITFLFFAYHLITRSVPSQYENETTTFEEVSADKTQKIVRTLSGNTIKCNDFDVVKHVKQKRNFYVLTNFVQAKRKFRCDESVTFASPADFTFLDNLETLVERWRAPVSVALYAPGYDFETTMDSINFLRECRSLLIEEYVTFHLFFDGNHLPTNTNYSKPINCQADPPFTKQESYKTAMNLTFPINIARNVAKEEAQTHFVMTADIELIPTPNFVQKFLEMMLERPELFDDADGINNAFVLPIFEVPENEVVPETKTQLKKMYAEKRAFVFHEKLCKVCHKVPEGDKWLAANETEVLDVFAMGKRQGTFKTWEPFYVATKEVPHFDERLTWEGQSNKMTQGYLMCLMDYHYLILNDAFLVHKPGIKKSKTQLKKYGQLVRDTNRMLKNTIKLEYDTLYGTRKGCFLS